MYFCGKSYTERGTASVEGVAGAMFDAEGRALRKKTERRQRSDSPPRLGVASGRRYRNMLSFQCRYFMSREQSIKQGKEKGKIGCVVSKLECIGVMNQIRLVARAVNTMKSVAGYPYSRSPRGDVCIGHTVRSGATIPSPGR